MRTLVLGLGNSSLIGGVFEGARLVRSFRRAPHQRPIERGRCDAVALCSVVPARTAALVAWCEKHLGYPPLVLTARAAHGLTLGYRDPRRLGTDRIAAGLGARALHPENNVIVVDCGTATTITALSREGCLLGGAIFPGLSLWGDSLAARTAQLPRVAPARPRRALGRSTVEGIASGTHFGHLGAVRELVTRVATEAFGRQRFIVIGTGGHAAALHRDGLFTVHEPALVLHGLRVFAAQTLS